MQIALLGLWRRLKQARCVLTPAPLRQLPHSVGLAVSKIVISDSSPALLLCRRGAKQPPLGPVLLHRDALAGSASLLVSQAPKCYVKYKCNRSM
jgi:hypothetical protein